MEAYFARQDPPAAFRPCLERFRVHHPQRRLSIKSADAVPACAAGSTYRLCRHAASADLRVRPGWRPAGLKSGYVSSAGLYGSCSLTALVLSTSSANWHQPSQACPYRRAPLPISWQRGTRTRIPYLTSANEQDSNLHALVAGAGLEPTIRPNEIAIFSIDRALSYGNLHKEQSQVAF